MPLLAKRRAYYVGLNFLRISTFYVALTWSACRINYFV